jgi:hypothetical protein
MVPMPKTGVADPVLDVRIAAAEGLAALNAEAAAAVPVLTAALASKDPAVLGRAMAALVKLGARPTGRDPRVVRRTTDLVRPSSGHRHVQHRRITSRLHWPTC